MNTFLPPKDTATNGNRCPLCGYGISLARVFRLVLFYLEDAWYPLMRIFLISCSVLIPLALALYGLIGAPPFDITWPLALLTPGLEMHASWKAWGKLATWLVFSWGLFTLIARQVFAWFHTKEPLTYDQLWGFSRQNRLWLLGLVVLSALGSAGHWVKESCPQDVCQRPTQVIALRTKANQGPQLPPTYLSTQSIDRGDTIHQHEVNIGACQVGIKGAGYVFQNIIPHIFWGRVFHYILEGALTVIGLYLIARLILSLVYIAHKHPFPFALAFKKARRATGLVFLGSGAIVLLYLFCREVIQLMWRARAMLGLGLILTLNTVLWTMIYSLFLVVFAHVLTTQGSNGRTRF
ncbi:hypothetical protein EIL50_02040 [bacterium NHP-B]|nr:hypothetical protein EIL50_02040 [bacterium NHP-B]